MSRQMPYPGHESSGVELRGPSLPQVVQALENFSSGPL